MDKLYTWLAGPFHRFERWDVVILQEWNWQQFRLPRSHQSPESCDQGKSLAKDIPMISRAWMYFCFCRQSLYYRRSLNLHRFLVNMNGSTPNEFVVCTKQQMFSSTKQQMTRCFCFVLLFMKIVLLRLMI